MNDIYKYEFPKYLDYIDYYNFGITCKKYYSLLKREIKKKREQKIREIYSFFNDKFINMVGRNNLLCAKNISWNKEWEIEDYYTDVRFLPYSLSYTRDNYDRSFLFTRVKVSAPFSSFSSFSSDSSQSFNTNYEDQTIITISQKYTDILVYYISDPKNFAINGYNFIDEEIYNHIQTFFKTKTFSYITNPYSFIQIPLYSKMDLL